MDLLTEPEPPRGVATRVAPGIRRLVASNPGVMTYRGTNTYLIDADAGVADRGIADRGVIVLDPGPDDPGHVEHIIAEAGGPITSILLTHTHRDHVGALAALRGRTGAPVAAWHDPADPMLVPDRPLRDGERVGAWQALHTPGHAADHLSFVGPGGVLFSGDHVMTWSSTVVGPPGGNMADYFASLDRLLTLDVSLCLPGHGPPLAGPLPFVRSLLEHRRWREAAILGALAASPLTVRDLAALLYPNVDLALRRAAERNVTAHLLKLRSEGRAAETDAGWRSVEA
ncbi:MAG: MBL fold metallo-hydrolase [Acetobacteraceae bacterium]